MGRVNVRRKEETVTNLLNIVQELSKQKPLIFV